MWAETQKKVEASKIQQEALNKLNQELSRQLKEQRKAAPTMSSADAMAAVAAPLTTEGPKTQDKLDRIDTLLAEIEAGFSSTRGLNIIENDEKAPAQNEPETRI